jgi:hypothetical protein
VDTEAGLQPVKNVKLLYRRLIIKKMNTEMRTSRNRLLSMVAAVVFPK